MERANARRLQPHFISSFFITAFQHLGGTIREREPKRYEVKKVPSSVRMRDRVIGTRETVLTQYERIAFDKNLLNVPGSPTAAFVCPGHPLLDASIDLILERYRDLLKQGTVLIDEQDPSEKPRVLFYLEHSIQDAGVLTLLNCLPTFLKKPGSKYGPHSHVLAKSAQPMRLYAGSLTYFFREVKRNNIAKRLEDAFLNA